LRSTSGETYGALLLSLEYPSAKDYGVSYDKVMKDDEILSVSAAVDGSDSPYTSQTRKSLGMLHAVPPRG